MALLPSFFLGIRPGELLYSALARHAEASGAAGPKSLMSALFGRADVIATVDLPNNLGALADGLPREAGTEAEDLAWNHTLLPYYTHFQNPAVAGRALAAMVKSGGSVHVMLGISTFRTGRPSHLQFCADCAEEMLEEFGSLHWRCVHQLPGVLVCPDHGSPLRRSGVCLAAANRHEFVPATAETCALEGGMVTSTMTDEGMAGALAIAKASAALLSRPAEPVSGAALPSRYHDALRTAGLIKGRFKVDQRELASRLRLHWGGLLDRLEGVGFENSCETWLASLVRAPAGARPPLQHLLLRLFLEAQPAAPPAPVRISPPRRRRLKTGRVNPRSEPRLDWRSIDAGYARDIRRGAQAVFRTSPPRRVTLGAVEKLLGRRDWLSKRRTKLPMSTAAARSIHEDVRAFQMRRLRWHAVQCLGEGVTDPWILLRRAGLGGSMIDAARSELSPAGPLPAIPAERPAQH